MAEKSTIQKDLGVSIRNRIRLDTTILAFNPTVTAQNWIFFGRPKDLAKKLTTPKIVLEPIDELREPYTVDKKKDILIPYLIHAWLDKADSNALASYEIGDRLKKIVEDLDDDPDSQGIWEAEVASFSVVPEPEQDREIDHTIVRAEIVWRENLDVS